MSDVKVGDGATYYCGSDRYPYTVIEVLSPNKVVVQEDRATCTNYETQEYLIGRETSGRTEVVTLRKNGRWVIQGDTMKGFGFGMGYRQKYNDPSF